MSWGDLTVSYAERRVTLAGRPVPLTVKEYGTLAELSANVGRVLTYEHLRGGSGDLRVTATARCVAYERS